MSKAILVTLLLLSSCIIFSHSASAEVATFRKDTDNCRPISLTEGISTTLTGNTGKGCTFSVDVRATGDWVMTGAYFDSPPYGWGGDNYFTIDERVGADDGNSRLYPYSFTCSQPNYSIDQAWLPSFITLLSTQNLSGTGVSVPQGKRYTFQVATNAPIGTSFEIPLSFTANCDMFVDKSGTILRAEPVTNSSNACTDQTVININPRTAQFDYTTTVSSNTCGGGAPTPLTSSCSGGLLNNYSFEVVSGGVPSGWNGSAHAKNTSWVIPPDNINYGYNLSSDGSPMYQDINVTAGKTYSMRFYSASHNAGTQLIYMEYLNSSNNVIPGTRKSHTITKTVTTTSPFFGGPYTLTMDPAPSNATKLRVSVDANGNDWAKIDAACLTASGASGPTNTPTPTRTPTPTVPSAPTPTTVSTPTGSCPAGTELLFSELGPLPIGSPTALGGTVTDAVTPWAPEWDVENRNGVPLAWSNTGLTVTFPQNVVLDTVLMYDHDPQGKGVGWSINGVQLPWGADDVWSPPYALNRIANQMIFDYGADSPHFNICVRSATGGPTPTPTVATAPTGTPTPFHTACSATSCVAVAGVGANACSPAGGFCRQTVSGSTGTTCPSACGTTTTNQSCTCSGPCCPGTCRNGLACGEVRPVTCCTSTQPQGPTAVTVTQPDGGAIVHTRFVKVNWNFPSVAPGCGTAWGHNCAGNGNTSFSIYIDDNDDFSSRIISVDNIPPTARTYTTTLADGVLRNNTTYYAQVCAVNYLANCTEITFIKRAYPVGIITGSLGEFDNQSPGNEFTLTGIGGTTTSFNINPTTATGISSTCSTTTAGTPPRTNAYNCSITLDNVNNDPVPSQVFAIISNGFNPQLYTNPCFQTGATTCSANTQVNMDYDTNGGSNTNINQNIYFALNPGLTFMKIKNTSLISHGSLSTPFPVFTTLFDASGDDYNNDGNFLIIGNNSGSIGGVGTGIFAAAPPLGSGLVSRKSTPPYPPGQNWSANNYFPITPFNNQRFLEYVKTRKSYQIITNLNQLATDKINVWNGSLSINNAAHFNSKNVTLIVTGTVSLSTNTFDPAQPSSTAIIADRINFYDGAQMVDEARGIFVGNTIDFGVSDEPIKITGNVASTTNAVNISRVRTDNRKPSLFVNFDIDQYINLLPYISTATYDWKQLQ